MKFTDARKYKKEVNSLYKTAFPREERAPLPFLYQRMQKGQGAFYAVTDKDEFIGLVYIISIGKLAYVFYLAIRESKRGQGYGTKILGTLKKKYKDYTLILNIEDPGEPNAPNPEERRNRLHFYEENGFQDLHIRTVEAGVTYELLGTKKAVTQADYLQLMKSYMGSLLFEFVFKDTALQQ